MDMLVPGRVTPYVLKFATSLSPDNEATYLTVEPWIGSAAGECFFNCRKHNAVTGSRTIFGWAIWEISGKVLEAEHHAICELNGRRFCVTPQPDLTDRILFVEDDRATYDFSDRRTVHENRYANVCGFKLIDELILARQRLMRYMRTCTDKDGQTVMDFKKYEALRGDLNRILHRVLRDRGHAGRAAGSDCQANASLPSGTMRPDNCAGTSVSS